MFVEKNRAGRGWGSVRRWRGGTLLLSLKNRDSIPVRDVLPPAPRRPGNCPACRASPGRGAGRAGRWHNPRTGELLEVRGEDQQRPGAPAGQPTWGLTVGSRPQVPKAVPAKIKQQKREPVRSMKGPSGSGLEGGSVLPALHGPRACPTRQVTATWHQRRGLAAEADESTCGLSTAAVGAVIESVPSPDGGASVSPAPSEE